MKSFINGFNKVHFIGIGGISMSALAKFCLSFGKTVSGSDKNLSDITKELQNLGAMVYLGHHKESVIGKDLVVFSSAIDLSNPELCEARKRGIKTIERGEFLGRITETYKNVIAVCGCHGKTTATAMIWEVFERAKLNPTVFLGGEYKKAGNFKKGGKEYLIAEACEYKKNFLNIAHTASVVLNIDNDHMDSYESFEDMKKSFLSFIGEGLTLVNNDDKNSFGIFNKLTASYGIKTPSSFMAKNISPHGGKYSFDVYAYGKKSQRIELNVSGRHNIYNALACYALCYSFDIPSSIIKEGLENFSGVKRRNEFIGKIGNANCYADYAHHPTEIKSYLKSVDSEKRLVVFQPHTYSRTKNLLSEFVSALKKEDLILLKTYSAREQFDMEGSAETLAEEINKNKGHCEYFLSDSAFIATIKERAKNYKNIYFIGAGDIYEKAKKILDKN